MPIPQLLNYDRNLVTLPSRASPLHENESKRTNKKTKCKDKKNVIWFCVEKVQAVVSNPAEAHNLLFLNLGNIQ